MQTQLPDTLRQTRAGEAADRILRQCVHCGFCTATCPTYLLLGDELDGPRGRIYQIKQVLEDGDVSQETWKHLDRCLMCRSCETTCPSGVQYVQLLETGREVLAQRLPRPWHRRLLRWGLRKILPYPSRLRWLVGVGRVFRPLLPARLKKAVPAAEHIKPVVITGQDRKVILFQGCAQSVLTARVNVAAASLLQRIGVEAVAVQGEQCCGAVPHHLDAPDEARQMARNNIDRWLAELDAGAEALIVTASACLLEVREYAKLFADDPVYAERAQCLQSQCQDFSEYLEGEALSLRARADAPVLHFHAPCTLKHGLGIDAQIVSLLKRIGFTVIEPADAHLCCGSAGTYSLQQPQLSERLRHNKLKNLTRGEAGVIVTANVGCQLHLQAGSEWPVMHWLEVLTGFCET